MPDNETLGTSPTLAEVFLSSPETESSDKGIWKTILKEGEIKMTPLTSGVLNKPFRVVKDGPSDPKNLTISMAELVDNFKDKAFEHVTVPLSHKDTILENTGFIEDVKLVAGDDGKTKLMGLHKFTEPDVKGKVERGTIANCSSGIYFDFVRKADGKKYNAALKHVALTNTPWVPGMEKFGEVMASDDDKSDAPNILSINLEEPSDSSERPVWDETESLNWRRTKLQGTLNQLQETASRLGSQVYYWIEDVASDRAIISQEQSGDKFVVPFTVEDNDLKVADPSRWVEAKSIMVAASDDPTYNELTAKIKDSLKVQFSLEDAEIKDISKRHASVQAEDKIWEIPFSLSDDVAILAPKELWRASDDVPETKESPVPQATTSSNIKLEDKLQEAHRQRELRLSNENNGNVGGSQMPVDLKELEGLELSDEARAVVDKLRQDNEELQEKAREQRVTERIEELKGLGLDAFPGVLKTVRSIYLSDKGEIAEVLELSDDNGKVVEKKGVSATDIADLILDSFPKKDNKFDLGQQALLSDGEHNRPPANTSEENKSHQDKLREAQERLYGEAPERSRRRVNSGGES